MKKFNFDTNIEKRMPTTGKVYYVDRMTSDYALAHPFNVDEFIEHVYQKYEQLAQEDAAFFADKVRDRNSLRQIWTAVMTDMNPRGDASIYPNRNGRHEPALMEVWLKAGDYWRMGFRMGDVLPAIVPGHRITRLGEGEWIALFPKDKDLLESHTDITEKSVESVQSVVENTSAVSHQPSYIEQDLFAQMQMQHSPTPRRQRRAPKPRYEVPAKSVAVAISQPEPMIDMQAILKFLGVLAVVCVVLLVIYNTGLLIPLGLIGLGIGGILK